MEVHRQLGPGLPERNYQTALAIEFQHQRIAFSREPSLPVFYRNIKIGKYSPDFIVQELIVIEIKAVDRYDPVFATQVLTYLRLSKLEVGLLFNFNRPTLKDGVKRFVLSRPDSLAEPATRSEAVISNGRARCNVGIGTE